MNPWQPLYADDTDGPDRDRPDHTADIRHINEGHALMRWWCPTAYGDHNRAA